MESHANRPVPMTQLHIDSIESIKRICIQRIASNLIWIKRNNSIELCALVEQICTWVFLLRGVCLCCFFSACFQNFGCVLFYLVWILLLLLFVRRRLIDPKCFNEMTSRCQRSQYWYNEVVAPHLNAIVYIWMNWFVFVASSFAVFCAVRRINFLVFLKSV